MNAELMRLRLKLMTMLVLTTLGCVTAGSLSTTTGGPRRLVQSVVARPPGWVFWREPGIGAHWPVARAQVANRGQVLIRVGRRALLRDLATGRDVATFTLPPVSSSGRSLPPLEEGPTAVSADGSLVALSEGNTVAAFARENDAPISTTTLQSKPLKLAFTPDNLQLVVLVAVREGKYPDQKTIQNLVVIDARTGAHISSNRIAGLESVSLVGSVVVVETGSPEPRSANKQFEAHTLKGDLVSRWSFTDVKRVEFSSNGSRAVALGGDGSVRLGEQSGESVFERPLTGPLDEGRAQGFGFVDSGRAVVLYREFAYEFAKPQTACAEVLRFDSTTFAPSNSVACRMCLGRPRFSPDGSWALGADRWSGCALAEISASAELDAPNTEAVESFAENTVTVTAVGTAGHAVVFRRDTGEVVSMPDGGKSESRSSCVGCLSAVLADGNRTVPEWGQPNRAALLGRDALEVFPRATETAPRAVAVRGDCVLVFEASNTRESGWGEGVCLRSPGPLLESEVVISRDSQWAVVVGENGVPSVWDLEHRTLSRVLDSSGPSAEVTLDAVTENGEWVFGHESNARSSRLFAWTPAKSAPRWAYEVIDATIEEVAVSREGPVVALALSDGQVLLFDQEGQATLVADLRPSLDFATALYWLDGGKRLIMGTSRGAIGILTP